MQTKCNGMSEVEYITNIDNIGMVWKIHISTLKWDIKRSNLIIFDRVMCNFPEKGQIDHGTKFSILGIGTKVAIASVWIISWAFTNYVWHSVIFCLHFLLRHTVQYVPKKSVTLFLKIYQNQVFRPRIRSICAIEKVPKFISWFWYIFRNRVTLFLGHTV